MIRLAFLSTAHIHSKDFLNTLAGRDDAEAACVWDDMHERGRSFAQRFGTTFEPSLDKVLADESIDGYVVLCETTRHLALLEQVLPAGKPVLCEKPLAATANEARRIATLTSEHRQPLISGYFLPFFGDHRKAGQLVREGKLGRLTHAHYRKGHHAAYARWFDSPELAWFADRELAGGGAMMDMGTHAVHLLRHLVGPVQRVWAMTRDVSGHYGIDDYGVMQLQFQNGVSGRVETGWCFTGGQHGLELIGSDAAIWAQPQGLVLGSPGSEPEPIGQMQARPDRIERLLAVIRGELDEQELHDDLSACLDAVQIMDAAYRSAQSGTWESVPPTRPGQTR